MDPPMHPHPFQLLEYQMVWWVCRFDINLGLWPSLHSHHQCTLVAEALVIIPAVTAMPEEANENIFVIFAFVDNMECLS